MDAVCVHGGAKPYNFNHWFAARPGFGDTHIALVQQKAAVYWSIFIRNRIHGAFHL